MNRTNRNAVETLESRQMMSATPAVVGYLPDWNAGEAMVDRIDWNSVTTVNYFSVIPNGTGNLPGTGNNTSDRSMSDFDLGQLGHVVDVAKEHGVKVNIVIGGAGTKPTNAIENVLASESKRKTFAKSVNTFMQKYGLDGVDVDYEPAGPSDEQIENYGDLLKRINNKIGNRRLTTAVAAETLPTGSDWSDRRYLLNADAVSAVDEIGIMAYDFTPGDGQSGWTRSFDALGGWGTYVDGIESGSKDKLLLGLPFYGRAGSNDWENPGVTGMASYGAILNAYADANGQLPATGADNVTATVTKGDGAAIGTNTEWYFNGPDTIAAKSECAMWKGAGGVMIWDLTQDYFTADGAYDQTHSLLPAVKRGLENWADASGNTLSLRATVNSSAFASGSTIQPQDRVGGDVLTGGTADLLA